MLEEVVRGYFAKQGFFAIRSVPLRFEKEDVTDVDIWLYGRQSASVRIRAVVDVKNKKSPRALERILWTKGLQTLTGADRAVVVTTDSGPHIIRFGQEQKVTLLTKAFLSRVERRFPLEQRISWEDLLGSIKSYKAHKTDGDWVRRLEDAKSGLISVPGFRAFNRALSGFAFFAERIQSRPHYAEQALRSALLCAAVGCVALDMAMERVVFGEVAARYEAIVAGITYGDNGNRQVQRSIENVLALIEESMENGRVVARQAREHINQRFASVRADLVAEYFSREHNASQLVAIARELDAAAHRPGDPRTSEISAEARALLGIFADFVQVPRRLLIRTPETTPAASSSSDSAPIQQAGTDTSGGERVSDSALESGKLL